VHKKVAADVESLTTARTGFASVDDANRTRVSDPLHTNDEAKEAITAIRHREVLTRTLF